MHGTVPTVKHPRRFDPLPNLAVPDTVDDPLPDTETDAWEAIGPLNLSVYQANPDTINTVGEAGLILIADRARVAVPRDIVPFAS
jgi:hypothetical protein